MVNDNFSCIKEVTKTVHIALPTPCTSNEISGICDVLETWKRQYIQQLKAIVVSFRNVSLTSARGYINLDCPVVHHDVKATFELFYPTVGSILKGKINRVCHDYIGCLVHNTINVTIDNRPQELSSDIANFIALDRFILFEITRLDYKRKIIRVTGKITQKCIDLMKESGMFDVTNHEFDSSTTNSNENVTKQARHIIYSDEENNSVFSDKTASDTNLCPSLDASSSETVISNKAKKMKKKKPESGDSGSSPKKKHKTKERSVSNELHSKNEINLFEQTDQSNCVTPDFEQTSNKKKKHKKHSNKLNDNIVSQDLFGDFSYSFPIDIDSIKREPVDENKKTKKRKRESVDTDSLPKKKKKTKDESPFTDLDLMKELDLFNNLNDGSDTSSLASTVYAPSPEKHQIKRDEISGDISNVPDHQSLLINDVKKDSLHKSKKAKKRTRVSGATGSPAKKRKKSDDGDVSSKVRNKEHGKKKNKEKSKKDKKKSKDKVISTKKKPHGYKNNLKKKNKDKKEKSKSTKDKSKTKKDKSKAKKDDSKTKKDKSKTKKDKSKAKKIKTEIKEEINSDS